MNFWDSDVWQFLVLLSVLIGSLLITNILKQLVKPIKNSLIPSSVMGGLLLLIISTIVKVTTGSYLFDLKVFSSSGNGMQTLEIITYHCLGIGFIAMALRKTDQKFSKKRSIEVFDTGVTTVATYLVQAIVGLAITIVAGFIIVDSGFFNGSGILLPFGYGQGTGQAMNYGNIYETEAGFVGGKSFGLTIAALGFLSASIVGVIYLNIEKKKGRITIRDSKTRGLGLNDIQEEGEIPMTESFDKLTVQIGIVLGIYVISYFAMLLIGNLVPGVRSLIFGFNFMIGTLFAVLVKKIFRGLKKKGIMKREYINTFLMNRIGGFVFDLMIVAGIGAIKLDLIANYWFLLIILGLAGAVITFFYVNFVSKKLFPEYRHEQFLGMFGMLTGTASTGMILLREIDPEFESPVSDNLVYQTMPAIVFGFPMMLIGGYVYTSAIAPYVTLGAVIVLFVIMNLILFRRSIFGKKKKSLETNIKEENQ